MELIDRYGPDLLWFDFRLRAMPDHDRAFTHWRTSYRTVGQAQNLRFIPLYEIRDESYAVYFPKPDRSRNSPRT